MESVSPLHCLRIGKDDLHSRLTGEIRIVPDRVPVLALIAVAQLGEWTVVLLLLVVSPGVVAPPQA